jgi:hypothetical protein
MPTTDFVICALPAGVLDKFPAAPGVLKAAAQEFGFTAQALDLNLEFFIDQCNGEVAEFSKLSLIFAPHVNSTQEYQQALGAWIDDSIDKFMEINPAVIGLSIFSEFQQRAGIWLARAIRQRMPAVKIVFGGLALGDVANGLLVDGFVKKIDLLNTYEHVIRDKKLSDYIVFSNEFDQLATILETVTGRAAVNPKRYTEYGNKMSTPIIDIGDYKVEHYQWEKGLVIPITTSKGCVRNCTFCNIPGLFGKFRYKNADEIVEELISQQQRYQPFEFEFTDSLVNGAPKIFKAWLEKVAEYNLGTENKLRWLGQYICRPLTEASKGMYQLMQDAGVTNLTIGVESGSDEVLAAMDKKMTSGDVLAELEMFKKYNIRTTFLMMSGFHNETWENFVSNLEFIAKIQYYVAAGVISQLSPGYPLRIDDNTELMAAADRLGITLDPTNPYLWTMDSDPNYDYLERVKRRLIVDTVITRLGISIAKFSTYTLGHVLTQVEQLVDDPGTELLQSTIADLIPGSILEKINNTKAVIKITLSSTPADQRWPMVRLIIDGQVVANQLVKNSTVITHVLEFPVGQQSTTIKLEYYNKQDNDTIVDSDGNILENQLVIIDDIEIDNISLISTKVIYHMPGYVMQLSDSKSKFFAENNISTDASQSLIMAENGSWTMIFELPIIAHICKINTLYDPEEIKVNQELVDRLYRLVSISKSQN